MLVILNIDGSFFEDKLFLRLISVLDFLQKFHQVRSKQLLKESFVEPMVV